MTERDKQWNMNYETLVEFQRKKGHCMVPKSYTSNTRLLCCGLVDSGPILKQTNFDKVEKEFWTKSGSLGQSKTPATSTASSGTSNIKCWSSLNEREDIVRCHDGTSKTSLEGSGLARSGNFIMITNFDQTEKDFWTKSGSSGKLLPVEPAVLPAAAVWVISQAKNKKNRNMHKGTLKTDLNVDLPTESEQVPLPWRRKWTNGREEKRKRQVHKHL
jgi:hypothetical protein